MPTKSFLPTAVWMTKENAILTSCQYQNYRRIDLIAIHCSTICATQRYTVRAHTMGYNRYSIGICYEGGLNERKLPADTRTPEQKETFRRLIERLEEDYPNALVVEHRKLNPNKACPCMKYNKCQ